MRKKETTAFEGIQMDGARERKKNGQMEKESDVEEMKSKGIIWRALRAAHTLSFLLLSRSRKFGEQRELKLR